jgi:hypothetical protein
MGKKYGALETPFMNDTESPSNVEMVMNWKNPFNPKNIKNIPRTIPPIYVTSLNICYKHNTNIGNIKSLHRF